MKYVQINSVPNGSTGRIMLGKHQQLLDEGVDSYVFWGRNGQTRSDREICFASTVGVYHHILMSRLTDKTGFFSKMDTKKLIKYLDEIDPDVVHLHNIHGYYVNVEMLFNWIKSRPKLKVYWTLHDCWSFTGHCAYFTYAHCDQWKTHCTKCCQTDTYPVSWFKDNCKQNFDRKKELFTGVNDLTIITPSEWLADLVKMSYLKEYDVKVINNEINTELFKPTESDFRQKYGLENKTVILGIAFPWVARKGLDHFIKLVSMLDDSYSAVVVGLSSEQIENLPDTFKGVTRDLDVEYNKFSTTGYHAQFDCDVVEYDNVYEAGGVAVYQDPRCLFKELTGKDYVASRNEGADLIVFERVDGQAELAKVYTACDYLVNTTLEENYPTVNLEAIACGTYVITYDTGGCRETIRSKQ